MLQRASDHVDDDVREPEAIREYASKMLVKAWNMIHQLKDRNAALERDLASALRELADARESRDTLTDQVRRMRRAASWRLTSPLREISRFLGKVKREFRRFLAEEGQPVKICFVSNEILGAHRNGGIGTATSNIAVLLASRGHAVTLFYVGSDALDPSDDWAKIYRDHGIKVIHHSVEKAPIYPDWLKAPAIIFEQLRGTEFDVIIFQDWKGLGHSCVVAKKCGLAFGSTTLVTIAHSNTPWMLFANGFHPTSEHLSALGFMEKQQVELSDAVVSPSAYLRDWMADSNWNLPKNTEVIPLFLGARDPGQAAPPSAGRVKKPNHLIFFGRLEERKGISIFLSAITSPVLSDLNFSISFLGKPSSKSVDEIRGVIRARRPDILRQTDFYPNRTSDEAQAFLALSSGVAVMPSLTDNSPCVIYECLRNKLSFIASRAGGIPELIHPDDHDMFLFEPTAAALTEKLREVLTASVWTSPRPVRADKDIADQWLDWVERQRPVAKASAWPSPPEPDVTVIVTHYERPKLLAQNLSALSLQSYRNFKVIVVDDGSTSRDAIAFLNELPSNSFGLDLKLVKQANQYVGAARNNGLSHLSTPFVIFMDDDNIAFPTMVDVLRNSALSSEADIVTCQQQFFYDVANEPDLMLLLDGQRWGFAGGPIHQAVIRNVFGDATAIYKREVFDRAGRFHEKRGVTYEDWQLYLNAVLKGCRLLSLPVPLFWYRVSPDSMYRTTNFDANREIIASTVRRHMPPEFAGLVDLAIGLHKGQ